MLFSKGDFTPFLNFILYHNWMASYKKANWTKSNIVVHDRMFAELVTETGMFIRKINDRSSPCSFIE